MFGIEIGWRDFFLIFKTRFTITCFKCSQHNIILQSLNLIMDIP